MFCDNCEGTCKPTKMVQCEDCDKQYCDECVEMFDDPRVCDDVSCGGTLVKVE